MSSWLLMLGPTSWKLWGHSFLLGTIFFWCGRVESIKQVKGNECSQYKSTAAIFSSSVPIGRFIFTLSYLGMFWVHVMQGYKGVCNLLLGMLSEATIKTCHIIWGFECKTCLVVTWENMDGANGQTRRKNRWRTFVLTTFISFGLCNIFAHEKYFLQSAHLSYFPPPNTISLPSRSQVRHSQIGLGLN